MPRFVDISDPIVNESCGSAWHCWSQRHLFGARSGGVLLLWRVRYFRDSQPENMLWS